MFFKLAWRNIWRNKRRSLITIASIMFAVFFAMAMRSIQLGMYQKMISNIVGSYTGYVQVHSKGYWDEKTLDNALELDKQALDDIQNTEGVKLAAPRLESFALGATEENTKGVMVVGLDPEKDSRITALQDKLVKGRYLHSGEEAILIGEELAAYFKVDINDTLVLLGQGRHGVSAAGKYPVKGIVKLSSPQLNSGAAFLPLSVAQKLYGAEGMVTSVALLIPDNDETGDVINELQQKLDTSKYEVMGWQQMMPELEQTIQADSAGGLIMLLILYMVISFGIFGTVLMMTAERKHEYGVLLAVGMKRISLVIVTFIETIMMAIVGVITGVLLAYPLTIYFHQHPIALSGNAAEALKKYGFEPVIPTSIDPSIASTHALVILIITLLITIYPALHIRRMRAVNAMRG